MSGRPVPLEIMLSPVMVTSRRSPWALAWRRWRRWPG